MTWEVWSVEFAVSDVQYEDWSSECGVKCGVWSAECGVRSVECEV